MPEAVPALAAWSNFYVIIGSSAAALTGLMFVVITLISRSRAVAEGVATFNTPTVVHFSAALLIAAMLTAPWPSLRHVGIALGIVALCGTVYTLRIMFRTTRLTRYTLDVEDWVCYAILPVVAYIIVLITAVLLLLGPPEALFGFGFAFAALLLILIGIHNAWDLVTYVALVFEETRPADRSDDDEQR
jgi:hypothetical protein